MPEKPPEFPGRGLAGVIAASVAPALRGMPVEVPEGSANPWSGKKRYKLRRRHGKRPAGRAFRPSGSRAASGVATCACGARISANKRSCRACAEAA